MCENERATGNCGGGRVMGSAIHSNEHKRASRIKLLHDDVWLENGGFN